MSRNQLPGLVRHVRSNSTGAQGDGSKEALLQRWPEVAGPRQGNLSCPLESRLPSGSSFAVAPALVRDPQQTQEWSPKESVGSPITQTI